MDLGTQVSYLVLTPGTPVYSCDEQEVGRVGQILADDGKDIFDGITVAGAGHDAYVPADEILAVYERGVVLELDAHAAAANDRTWPPAG